MKKLDRAIIAILEENNRILELAHDRNLDKSDRDCIKDQVLRSDIFHRMSENKNIIKDLKMKNKDVITAVIDIEDEEQIVKEYPELDKNADFEKLASDIYKDIYEKVDNWENRDLYVTFYNKDKAIWEFINGSLEFYPCDCGRGLIHGSAHMCDCCWDESC